MDDVFGMSIEVASIVVPTAATLIVFILGYFLNLTIAWNKSRLANRITLRSIKAWIEIVKVPSQRDIDELRKTAEASRQNEQLQQPRMEWQPLLGPKIENSITQDVINVLLKQRYSKTDKKEGQRLISNLVSQTHFLTEVEEQIKETYKHYKDESLKLKYQWNELYFQVREIINELLINDKGIEDSAKDKLIIIITNHNSETSQNKGNYKTAYETLVPQLSTLNNLNCNQLLNLLPKAELIYTQWKANNEGYGRLFDDYADSLESTLEKLIMCREKL